MTRRVSFVAAVAIAALLLPALAAATIIEVPGDQATIAAGLGVAVSGDTVRVAAGTYGETRLGPPSGVTLLGATGDPADVVIDIDGLSPGQVIWLDGKTDVVVEAITATNGNLSGGGFYLLNGSTATVTNCVISGNGGTVAFGGGLYCTDASVVTFVDCRFFGNAADNGGGAGFIWGGTAHFTDCLITGNTAPGGAALHYSSSSASSLTNCTFVENTSSTGNGMIKLENTDITLSRCIVALDAAGSAFDIAGSTVVTADCNDIWGNAEGNWTEEISGDLGINGNIEVDPEFCGEAATGNYLLQSDSPCAPANNSCAVLIGALPVDCGVTAMAPNSWSAIKTLY